MQQLLQKVTFGVTSAEIRADKPFARVKVRGLGEGNEVRKNDQFIELRGLQCGQNIAKAAYSHCAVFILGFDAKKKVLELW